MTHTDGGSQEGPTSVRRREGVAGVVGAGATTVGTGVLPAAGGPAQRASLTRGIFWRGARVKAVTVLAGLTATFAAPGFAHAAGFPGSSLAGAVGTAVGGTLAESPLGSGSGEEDAPSAGSYDADADPYSLARALANHGVYSAWAQGATGRGVRVAVLDSGVDAVPGLDGAGKVVQGLDVSLDAISKKRAFKDGYGHGTHLSGIIAGDDGLRSKNRKKSPSFSGVAPGADILAVKLSDGAGHVDVSQVIAGIDYVVATRAQSGVRVINLSFNAGGLQSAQLDPLSFAVEQAWKAGIVVVVSAGNDGDAFGRLQNPAQNPFVLAVGALDDQGTATPSDDVVPAFSARGDGLRNPDLVAPGRSVASLTAPKSHADKYAVKAGDRLVRASGTSQAAAFVSGAAALLLSKNPTLTPDQVKHLLTSTASPIAGVPATHQGAGVLDVARAVAAPVPGVEAVQVHAPSTGLGSLDASRGERRLELAGTVLSGEQDVWGQPFEAASYVGGAATRLLTGGDLSGASWSGASWSGASWSGASWSGASWSGASWSGASWSGASWSGASWSGASWSGASWSGASWS